MTMTLQIDISEETEAAIQKIPNLPEKVASFLKHQATLEAWRDERYPDHIRAIADEIIEKANKSTEQDREDATSQVIDQFDALSE